METPCFVVERFFFFFMARRGLGTYDVIFPISSLDGLSYDAAGLNLMWIEQVEAALKTLNCGER